MLSYVQSFLILNAFEYLPGSEVRDEEVPVDSLSVYDILARARWDDDSDEDASVYTWRCMKGTVAWKKKGKKKYFCIILALYEYSLLHCNKLLIYTYLGCMYSFET